MKGSKMVQEIRIKCPGTNLEGCSIYPENTPLFLKKQQNKTKIIFENKYKEDSCNLKVGFNSPESEISDIYKFLRLSINNNYSTQELFESDYYLGSIKPSNMSNYVLEVIVDNSNKKSFDGEVKFLANIIVKCGSNEEQFDIPKYSQKNKNATDKKLSYVKGATTQETELKEKNANDDVQNQSQENFIDNTLVISSAVILFILLFVILFFILKKLILKRVDK